MLCSHLTGVKVTGSAVIQFSSFAMFSRMGYIIIIVPLIFHSDFGTIFVVTTDEYHVLFFVQLPGNK